MPQPERRRIVLDEDVNWKLIRELHKRGRPDATAVECEDLNGRKDGALFKALCAYEPFVLVTWDNKMIDSHRLELEHHGTTLAVVDERWFKRKAGPNTAPELYIRDVVHRWVHSIEILHAGQWRVYAPPRSRAPRLASPRPHAPAGLAVIQPHSSDVNSV